MDEDLRRMVELRIRQAAKARTFEKSVACSQAAIVDLLSEIVDRLDGISKKDGCDCG